MKRLLAIYPAIDDATSFWRGVGPLSKLYLDGWTVQHGAGKVGWPDLIQFDGLFVQRPSADIHVSLIQHAKSLNLPVWIDYDDNLFDVPFSNPAFHRFARPDVQNDIRRCVAMADVVTVSTPDLVTAYRKDAVVVPNAWNDYNLPFKERQPTKTVLWRGSNTHDEDVMTWADDLVRMYNDRPEYQWVFFGGCPWQFLERLDDPSRFQVLSGSDTVSYLRTLEQIRPEWLIVPLKDSTFNRGKSNIAWLEATWAGAACLAPGWRSWDYDGVRHYDGSMYDTFMNTVESALFANWSVDTVKEQLLLSNVNEQRRDILRGW